jgi:hypothetical protein
MHLNKLFISQKSDPIKLYPTPLVNCLKKTMKTGVVGSTTPATKYLQSIYKIIMNNL